MQLRLFSFMAFILPLFSDLSVSAVDFSKRYKQLEYFSAFSGAPQVAQNPSLAERYRQIVEETRRRMREIEELRPPAERRLLELERIELSKWRFYGSCAYNWSAWKLHGKTGVRSTEKTCEGLSGSLRPSILGRSSLDKIYVRCRDLKVISWGFSVLTPKEQILLLASESQWTLPTYSDREMVIALCSSVKD